jgi:hypothetical protein
MPRLNGFRFPREIVAITLSTVDVEDLLTEWGIN